MAPPTLSTLLAADIPDPTDFPDNTTAPGLRQLDAALRCAICSELFEAPVTLACGHCFCSLCARSVIADKPECPTCRKPANEGQLRPTPATEDAISAWKLARPFVLQLLKNEESRRSRGTPSPPESPRKRKRVRAASPISEENGGEDSSDIEMLPGPSRPPLRMTPAVSSASSSSSSVPDSPRRRISAPGTPSKSKLRHTVGVEPRTGLVACPICGTHVQMDLINAHIDKGCKAISSAPAEVGQKAQWADIFGKAKDSKERSGDAELDEPLPKVSYQTLKDKAIRALLSEHKLSTTGDRAACIARHKRWVITWNANLDRAPALRRGLGELRGDLKRWEDEQTRAKAVSVAGVGSGIVYEQKHDAEFKALIEKARLTKGKPAARGSDDQRKVLEADIIVIPNSDA